MNEAAKILELDTESWCGAPEWERSRSAALVQIQAQLVEQVVIDDHNIFKPDEASATSLKYFGIGRA